MDMQRTREITFHKVPGKGGGHDGNDIVVLDHPGAGGANHEYLVRTGDRCTQISFQNGPIQEVGVNGMQQEDLLAIVIDRLEAFQRGPFANVYNADALMHARSALAALQQRTRDRLARGVEGLNKA